jgi:hypothetical protein
MEHAPPCNSCPSGSDTHHHGASDLHAILPDPRLILMRGVLAHKKGFYGRFFINYVLFISKVPEHSSFSSFFCKRNRSSRWIAFKGLLSFGSFNLPG